MKRYLSITLSLLLFASSMVYAQKASPVLKAAKKEMQRTMEGLKSEKIPPYFLAYHITETQEYRVNASFGKIKNIDDEHERILDIDLRVGDYKFDNSHIIRGSFEFGSGSGKNIIPISDDEKSIRNAIWYATDRTYKNALEKYDKVLTNQKVKVKEEDTSADFSREKAYKDLLQTKKIEIDKKAWAEKIKKLSELFNSHDWLFTGSVNFIAEVNNKYFVNSEGSELQWPEEYYRIYISGKTKADDGMSLPLYKSYFSFSPDGLPSVEEIENDIKSMITLLDNLRKAPRLDDTYSGPAILSGEASGVFFHEIFGHRVEGHREKDPNSSQTFKNSKGKKILPEFMDVIMDPTLKTLEGQEISGYYTYDDEGIKPQKVVVAKDGKFNAFLMSRSPIENYNNSNGHARKAPGYSPVSRQSNLIVKADEECSLEDLREKLRKQLKEKDLEWGLYFEKVRGGFTFTGRYRPNSFNVTPLVVYKVYADGRPDELIRGVNLIGTPLATFQNITDAADDLGIFNGMCGAESGGVPVSACSPTILVKLIEVQKKPKSQAQLPILPAPEKKDKYNQ